MQHVTTALKSLFASMTLLAIVLSPVYFYTRTNANYYNSVQTTPRYTQECYPALVFEQEHLVEDDFFKDIDFSPANKEISYLAQMGMIEGDGFNIFSPNQALTRAEYLKMVFLAFGHTVEKGAFTGQYSDVSSAHWAADLIATASRLDIINGYVDATFKPDQQITYAEAIKMSSRATNCNFWDASLLEHGVINQTWSNNWFDGYMQWAADNGIYNPNGTNPSYPMVRWQGAKLTYDIMEYVNATLGIDMTPAKHV